MLHDGHMTNLGSLGKLSGAVLLQDRESDIDDEENSSCGCGGMYGPG